MNMRAPLAHQPLTSSDVTYEPLVAELAWHRTQQLIKGNTRSSSPGQLAGDLVGGKTSSLATPLVEITARRPILGA